jgi:3-polyprenyl-4-hydroxybenzoate decarboxylase
MGYDILASGPADIEPTETPPVQHFYLRPECIAETKEQVTERMMDVQGLF